MREKRSLGVGRPGQPGKKKMCGVKKQVLWGFFFILKKVFLLL